jgi:membrane-bound lytic murein transglycosylase D
MAFLRFILMFFVSLNLLPKNRIPEIHVPETTSSPSFGFPDLYYEINIADLNTRTSIELYYDQSVQSYIDLFLTERKEQLQKTFRLSKQYFPIFEKHLKANGIPEEIKYIPVIESGLSPTACSPSMAVGLWQFKEATGQYYGLKIGTNADDRQNPELSTIAACRFLNDLYREFKDWDLALLAYNAGPVAVRHAIQIAGRDASLHDIIAYLPEPAKKYLPALIAVIYLFNDFNSHFQDA